jgi:chromosome segregation ATPase
MTDVSSNGKRAEQTIEVLQERYLKLNQKKIEAETELRGAKQRLEELQKEAREKYGTDDLAELQKKLEAMQAENERKRAEYQTELDRIEGNLQEVERSFTDTEASARSASKESR